MRYDSASCKRMIVMYFLGNVLSQLVCVPEMAVLYFLEPAGQSEETSGVEPFR